MNAIDRVYDMMNKLAEAGDVCEELERAGFVDISVTWGMDNAVLVASAYSLERLKWSVDTLSALNFIAVLPEKGFYVCEITHAMIVDFERDGTSTVINLVFPVALADYWIKERV